MAKRKREEAHDTFSEQRKCVWCLILCASISVSSQVPTSHMDQQNECSLCMGKYEDDLIDGELQNEWICCTACSRRMHIDCLVSFIRVFDAIILVIIPAKPSSQYLLNLSGETHSVVKLFTAVSSSRLTSIKSRVAI